MVTMTIQDNEQVQVRLAKRLELAEKKGTAYASQSLTDVITSILEVKNTYLNRFENNEQGEDHLTLAGRVMRIRHAGGISFGVLADGQGNTIQLMFSRAEIGMDNQKELKSLVDLGDFLKVEGRPARSSTGELSLYVTTWAVISKSLRPLPNQHDDLNEETRVTKRYLDFLMNSESRERMVNRSKAINNIRNIMVNEEYLEVETPMLQTQQGGATARPFITHSNAMDTDLYLRIAPELFLKRAVIGGFDRVFEINKNFRNEGMDSTHSPEFTMMEGYQAYADYNDVATLVERLIHSTSGIFKNSSETPEASNLDTAPWERISLYNSLSEALGVNVTPSTTLDELLAHAELHDVEGALRMKQPTAGKLVEELWEHLVLPTLVAPTFVMDYPADSSPLVAPHRSIPGVVEKWDLYINGMEVATGYSELVDPVIQRERLEAQALLATNGDVEAMSVDEDFLEALEHGMPPTGGFGLGIDRLIMLFTNRGIRDTVMFPLVK